MAGTPAVTHLLRNETIYGWTEHQEEFGRPSQKWPTEA